MTTLVGGARSDVGRVRSVNQDGALSSPFLFAVADGMGGHRGGEVASALALRSLGGRSRFADADELVSAVEVANELVYGTSRDDPNVRGMGTTLCAIALVEGPGPSGGDEHLVLVNVGDSRAYRLAEGGELEQLTVDHSLVQMMVDDGQITAEEAEHHPQRNIVTRVLGVEAHVDVDVWELDAVPGQRFLVCSDGLFGEVEPERIAAELRRWDDPREAAHQLVELANAAGGRDNITCAIFDVRDDEGDAAPGGEDAGAAAATAAARGGDGGRPTHSGEGTAAALTGGPRTAVVDRVDEAAPRDGRAERVGRHDELPARSAARGPRPRRFTGRVALFVLALLAVLGLAAVAVGWYATRTYFVGVDGGAVAIYRGRPGGVLWFDPTVAELTDLELADLPPQSCEVVTSQPSTTDLDEARAIVERLREDLAAKPPGAARCEPG